MNISCGTYVRANWDFGGHRQIAEYSGITGAADRQRLEMPDPPQGNQNFTEVRVPVGRPFNLGYWSNANVGGGPVTVGYACSEIITFQPEAGADYEAVVDSGSISRPKCSVRIARLNVIGGTVQRLQVPDAKVATQRCSP